MKKILIIGLIVSLALIVVGGAGMVYAKVQEAANPTTVTVTTTQNGDQITRQFGPGMMQNGNGVTIQKNGRTGDDGIFIGPGGMMGGNGYETGPNGNGNRNGPGGMMGGYGPGGMMGGKQMMSGVAMSVMRKYMISAFASAVGLTADEVANRLANGETPQQIALAQGKTQADLAALWTQVHKAALDQAVKDGVIPQAQADVMQQRMDNYSGEGFGPGFGNCPMNGGDETQQP